MTSKRPSAKSQMKNPLDTPVSIWRTPKEAVEVVIEKDRWLSDRVGMLSELSTIIDTVLKERAKATKAAKDKGGERPPPLRIKQP